MPQTIVFGINCENGEVCRFMFPSKFSLWETRLLLFIMFKYNKPLIKSVFYKQIKWSIQKT